MTEDLYSFKLSAFLHSSSEFKSDIKNLDDAISDLKEFLGITDDEEAKTANITSFAMSSFGMETHKTEKLRHPFSCEEFDASPTFKNEKCDKIKKWLDKVKSPENKFLTLWRHLPSVSELASDSTVFHNPCFWDIRSMASAIVATGDRRAYLYFTVAGVHEFISPSRRTQDLWVGSYLISYLMWKAMQPIVEELGPDVIVQPNLLEQPLVDVWLKEKGVNVSLPSADALKVANFPNFYFALVSEDKAKNLAEESERRFTGAWEEICCAVKRWVEAKVRNKGKNITFDFCWDGIWERQKNGVFEIYWAYCGWGESPEDVRKDCKNSMKQCVEDKRFEERFNRAEEPEKWGLVYPHLSMLTGQAVTQRKNLRGFNPVEEPGEKCTLCGIKEALRTSEYKGRKQVKELWEKIREELGIRLRKGEMLCGVCLTKRLAAEAYFKIEFEKYYNDEFNSNFPSTGSIASAVFKLELFEKLKNNDRLQKLMESYVDSINELLKNLGKPSDAPVIPRFNKPEFSNYGFGEFAKTDGEWLYEESLSWEKLNRVYEGKVEKQDQEKALTALKELRAEAKKLDIDMPSKYYALLYMDGDSMSKWVNGKNLPKLKDALPDYEDSEEKRPLSPSLHRSLSTALRNYALRVVRNVVEERHTGKLVYAGGDDVLAFVPLEDLLSTLRELRILFSGREYKNNGLESRKGFVKIGENGEWGMVMSECATASIGVVISHYLHPLYRAVDEVNDALFERAKEELDRDSFAITVIKKSGSILKTGAKWEYEGVDTIRVIERVVKLFRTDKLSTTLPYHLQEGGRGLEEFDIKNKESEFRRILRRHAADTGSREFAEVEEELIKLLYLKPEKKDDKCQSKKEGEKKPDGWERIVDLLLLARFIAGGGAE